MKRECDYKQINDDKQLKKWIGQIADGNTEALVLLYDAMFRPLCFFALSVLKSYTFVEDVAQETFIRVYQNAGQYQGKSSAKTWIFSIAKNICLDTLQKENKKSAPTNVYLDKCDFSLMESAEALRCLDEAEQQIMALYAFGGMRISEIAELLSIPLRQAYYCKDQAIDKLKNYYTQNQ